MTTSFETSLKMKELNFPQEGGEYYYYEIDGDYFSFHRGALITLNLVPIYRAFTLGELVRELGDGFSLFGTKGGYRAWLSTEWHELFNTSPEEAAGELLAELKQKEVSNV